MQLFDTHAHLDFVDDLERVIERAKTTGVKKIVCIGTSIDASRKCIEIAEKFSDNSLAIFATCGIHPEDGRGDIKEYEDKYLEELEKVAKSSDKVVGIGECGLDYHLSGGQREVTSNEDRNFQRGLFEKQIELAASLKLPLVVHCRNGWDEIFNLISKFQTQSPNLSGVFHSWTGDWEAAKKAISMGFYVSFSGILTFKNAAIIQEAAKKVPIEKIVVETDSPFLAPEPLRGKKNEPKNVRICAEFLAGIRNSSLDKISEVTSKNAQELFGVNYD